MPYEETMMRRKTGLLAAGWSILMMVGCSSLKEELPTTVDKLNTAECETCHSLQPQTEVHFEHILDTATLDTGYKKLLPLDCDGCHKGYDEELGWTDESKHRNGIIDTSTGECDYCHLVRRDCGWCHAIPPDQTDRQRKVHRHVTEQNYTCDVCHPGYDYASRIAPPATHNNGTINVRFDGAPKKAGSPAVPSYDNGVCYNLYCHGAATPGGKQSVAIDAVKPTGIQQCDFCHNVAQLWATVPDHNKSGHAELDPNCVICHENFSYTTGSQTIDTSLHLNGVIDTSMALCRVCHEEF